jgi:hypothetical protein
MYLRLKTLRDRRVPDGPHGLRTVYPGSKIKRRRIRMQPRASTEAEAGAEAAR